MCFEVALLKTYTYTGLAVLRQDYSFGASFGLSMVGRYVVRTALFLSRYLIYMTDSLMTNWLLPECSSSLGNILESMCTLVLRDGLGWVHVLRLISVVIFESKVHS